MLILGAGGFAKQLLDTLLQTPSLGAPIFFDDITPEEDIDLRHDFTVIRTWDEVAAHLLSDSRFALGTGNPAHRSMLFGRAVAAGGRPVSIISPHARVSSFHTAIGEGVSILEGVVVEAYATIGDGALLNLKAMVTHDCKVGAYSELGPASCMLGRSELKERVTLGAGATLLPRLTVGSDSVVATGAVVTADIPKECTVAGIPARQI